MRSFVASSAALLLAAALPFSAAQTYSTCNPMSQSNCPSDPGLNSQNSNTDFTKGASTAWKTVSGSVSYGSNGAQFTVAKKGDAPTIETGFYFFFGTAEVKMQAAPGTGIVSSIVLESDDLDEVDWECLGGDGTQIQSNYFGKGNTTTYDRATFISVASPQTTSHTYTVNWQRDQIQWLVDGNVVRTLTAGQAGNDYPQTPMRLRLGIWAGGDSGNSPGTIQWAGGVTDYSQGPFSMYVQSVSITNANPAASYSFGDQSGSAASVKVNSGSGSSSVGSEAPSSASSSSSSSSSSTLTSALSSSTSTSSKSTGTSTETSTGHSTLTSGSSSTTATTPTSSKTSTPSVASSISPSNPSSVSNPISGITQSNGTLPISNSTTSGTPSSASAAASATHSGSAVSNAGVSGSLVALYTFCFAMVAYVL